MPQTLYDKIWNEHVVHQQDDGTILLYVDRHLIHEVTSPQAFEGLRLSKRKVRKPHLTLAVADHNVPTTNRSKGIDDQESKIQVETLERNCKEFDIKLFNMEDKRQGIVHIIGPEQGFTQPGTVIVCGDSHTATHGAFGANFDSKKIKKFSSKCNRQITNRSYPKRCYFANDWQNRYSWWHRNGH